MAGRLSQFTMLLAGLGAVALAFLLELRPGSTRGFGLQQMLVLLIGLMLVARGAAVTSLSRAGAQPMTAAAGKAWLRFATTAVQLGLLVLIMRALEVESAAFYDRVLVLTFAGFVLHHLTPPRYRLSFFLALSLSVIVSVFGLTSAAWLVGLGLILFAICHLPIAFGARVFVLCLTGALLAFLRTGSHDLPWSASIWPILGSMFMFRLILYMYDLRTSKSAPNLTQGLAYFFLLPNVVFPLFPTVDYATFRRTYYDRDQQEIYERGVQWIARGLVHLLLYRVVYHHLTIPLADIGTPLDAGRYLLSNFFLYLRVSGQFHLIVGMLHLFGFRLPETHRFFYLASSFTDFWRRINIYWKDFMQKVVYYPVYFRIRKYGETTALILSTLVVFLATWLLHAYQWFWILGTFLLAWTDVLFWSILAVALVANSLWEARRGRQRTIGAQPRRTLPQTLSLVTRIVLTFTTICTLWSLWTSPTVNAWLAIWRVAGFTAYHVVLSGLAIGGFIVIVSLLVYAAESVRSGLRLPSGPPQWRPALATALLLLVYAATNPAVGSRLDWRAQAVVRDLRTTGLNRSDANRLHRGYYEALTGVDRFNGQLWEVYAVRPSNRVRIWFTPAGRSVGGFMRYEFRPLANTTYHGASLRTNRWGMRDRDYELAPPANTYRIALIGPSHAMGTGVADAEVFETLVEDRLNRERVGKDGRKIEILNFSMETYSPTQRLYLLEERVLRFQPDAVFIVGHAQDPQLSTTHLWQIATDGVKMPYPFLDEIVETTGLRAEKTHEAATMRLRPYRHQLVSEAYERIVKLCRQHGIRAVWIYVPMTDGLKRSDEIAEVRQLAQNAGFTIIDVSDAFNGYSEKSIQIESWDAHPNALGHRLIADRLYRELLASPEVLEPTPERAQRVDQPAAR